MPFQKHRRITSEFTQSMHCGISDCQGAYLNQLTACHVVLEVPESAQSTNMVEVPSDCSMIGCRILDVSISVFLSGFPFEPLLPPKDGPIFPSILFPSTGKP